VAVKSGANNKQKENEMKKNILKMDTSTNAGLPHYSVDEEAFEGGEIFTAGEVEIFDAETNSMIDSACEGVSEHPYFTFE
jgi:hypothetical protein